jgi:hypothetical protein
MTVDRLHGATYVTRRRSCGRPRRAMSTLGLLYAPGERRSGPCPGGGRGRLVASEMAVRAVDSPRRAARIYPTHTLVGPSSAMSCCAWSDSRPPFVAARPRLLRGQPRLMRWGLNHVLTATVRVPETLASALSPGSLAPTKAGVEYSGQQHCSHRAPAPRIPHKYLHPAPGAPRLGRIKNLSVQWGCQASAVNC